MNSYNLIPASLLEFIYSNDKVNFDKTLDMIDRILHFYEFCNPFKIGYLATSFNNVKIGTSCNNIITILFRRLRKAASKEEFDNLYYYIKTLLEFDIKNKSIITRYINWNEEVVLRELIYSCWFSDSSFKTEKDLRDAIDKCKYLIFYIFDNLVNANSLVDACSSFLLYYENYFNYEFDKDKQERLTEIRDAIFKYVNDKQLLSKSFCNISYLQFKVEKSNIEESINYATSRFPKLKDDEYFIKFISKFINSYISTISYTYSKDEETTKDFIERSKEEIDSKLKSFRLYEYVYDKIFIYYLFFNFIKDIREEKIHLRDKVLFNYLSKLTDNFSNNIGLYLKKKFPKILTECNNKYFYEKLVEAGWKESKKSKQLFNKLCDPSLVIISIIPTTKKISVKDIPLYVDEVKHKKLLESFVYATKCLDDIEAGIKVLREAVDANNINLLKILMKLHINPFVKFDGISTIEYCKKVGNKEAKKVLKNYYCYNC